MSFNNRHLPILQFSFMGEAALLCEAQAPDGVLQLSIQQRIWQLGEAIIQQVGVLEVVPSMNNLLVVFDAMNISGDTVKKEIQKIWSEQLATPTKNSSTKVHNIPVIYGGKVGEDITELAAYTGLSIEEIIKRHSEAEYTVYALGSQPGLPYLGGLDPQLIMPRREVPRTRVEAGAIIVGGSQASILSCTSACGWHIIGHTDVECFNPGNNPPALFSPGDVVKFIIKEVNL